MDYCTGNSASLGGKKMAKMVCTRLPNGDIELKVSASLSNVSPLFFSQMNTMLRNIRPTPLLVGCERIGNTDTTDCIVVLHSHTSDLGTFDAISQFGAILSAVVAIDSIDACGLVRK